MDKQFTPHRSIPGRRAHRRSPWAWLLVAGCVLLLLVAFLRPSRPEEGISPGQEDRAGQTADNDKTESTQRLPRNARSAPAATAEEVVARKLSQFARSRREYMYALARRHNVPVLDDVERFFDAVVSETWEAFVASF